MYTPIRHPSRPLEKSIFVRQLHTPVLRHEEHALGKELEHSSNSPSVQLSRAAFEHYFLAPVFLHFPM